MASVPIGEIPNATGPYDPLSYGSCACHGTPVNRSGRCQPLNLAEYPTAEPQKTAAIAAGTLTPEGEIPS